MQRLRVIIRYKDKSEDLFENVTEAPEVCEGFLSILQVKEDSAKSSATFINSDLIFRFNVKKMQE